jgi:tRNA dimethylallyltransferase
MYFDTRASRSTFPSSTSIITAVVVARPFGGLVYRQALEHLHGVRSEADTRELITRENRRYARRQLTWFRKEPDLVWFPASGESRETLAAVEALLT